MVNCIPNTHGKLSSVPRPPLLFFFVFFPDDLARETSNTAFTSQYRPEMMPGFIQAVELLLATHNYATYCPILRGKICQSIDPQNSGKLENSVLHVTLPCPTLMPSAFRFEGGHFTLITEYSGGSRI